MQNVSTPGAFRIVQAKTVAPIYVDSNDYPGVLRAVNDLQADIVRVSGATPAITHDENSLGANPIIAGVIGRSRIIDRLIREGKIDASQISGRWESFVIQVIAKPMPGVDAALIIAGSDKRGAIYGIYDLSEQIGVSPWYWWADVPVAHKDALFVKPGRYAEGEPSVKYQNCPIQHAPEAAA